MIQLLSIYICTVAASNVEFQVEHAIVAGFPSAQGNMKMVSRVRNQAILQNKIFLGEYLTVSLHRCAPIVPFYLLRQIESYSARSSPKPLIL